MTTSTSRRGLWTAASSVLLVLAWGLAARVVAREIILPTPAATLAYLGGLVRSPAARFAAASTMRRVLLSFLINFAVSICTGAAAGLLPRVEYALKPVISLMKAVPTMGVILLALIWFNSEFAVLFVCTLIVFPVLYSAVVSGIHHLDGDLADMHRVFRIRWTKKILRFVLPSLQPHLLAGLTSGFGLSMKVIIAAEVLSQPKAGIGTMLQIERAQLNTVGVFAWSAAVILLTSGIDGVLGLAAKRWGRKP